MVFTYGNIELDKSEMNLLELGPYFAIYEDINLDKVKAEFLTMLTKIRWDCMGKRLMKSKGGEKLIISKRKKR